MKIFQFFLLILIFFGLSSCVILTVKQYETQKKEQSLHDMKSAVHHLLIDQELRNDTTDLSSLLRLISVNYDYVSVKKMDERRLELISFDLIRTYNDYWIQKAPFEVSERKLEVEVFRYLDYIMNPDNEYLRFRFYWKKTPSEKLQKILEK